MCEYTKGVIRRGKSKKMTDNTVVKRKKQCFTKHYTEKKGPRNTDPTKNLWQSKVVLIDHSSDNYTMYPLKRALVMNIAGILFTWLRFGSIKRKCLCHTRKRVDMSCIRTMLIFDFRAVLTVILCISHFIYILANRMHKSIWDQVFLLI